MSISNIMAGVALLITVFFGWYGHNHEATANGADITARVYVLESENLISHDTRERLIALEAKSESDVYVDIKINKKNISSLSSEYAVVESRIDELVKKDDVNVLEMRELRLRLSDTVSRDLYDEQMNKLQVSLAVLRNQVDQIERDGMESKIEIVDMKNTISNIITILKSKE